MKMYCMSHDMEIAVGLKLTGIEAIVLQDENEVESQIEKILQDEKIGILIITNQIYDWAQEKFNEIKEKRKMPLLVKI